MLSNCELHIAQGQGMHGICLPEQSVKFNLKKAIALVDLPFDARPYGQCFGHLCCASGNHYGVCVAVYHLGMPLASGCSRFD